MNRRRLNLEQLGPVVIPSFGCRQETRGSRVGGLVAMSRCAAIVLILHSLSTFGIATAIAFSVGTETDVRRVRVPRELDDRPSVFRALRDKDFFALWQLPELLERA